MEKRRLGRTGHMSSVLTFGSAAFWQVSQAEADAAIEMAVSRGVNHFDVAPTYGQAELRLGPWMEKHHREIFLACKTSERGKKGAWESLKRSLDLLRVDYFDLFQFHGVSDLESLNIVLGPGGALEAVLEAKQQGLVKYIGITGHRPFVHVEALNRFAFDTVLFPCSRVLAAHRNDYTDFSVLLDVCKKKDVGTIGIKAVAKRPWETTMHMYRTWYEPFDTPGEIDACVWYALGQGITTSAMPSDLSLWPMVIDAAERLKKLSKKEREKALAESMPYRSIFPMA
jgi:aryl-alcohol dehydrogenase-like predicted oxidoreductase